MPKNLSIFLMAIGFAVPALWIGGTCHAAPTGRDTAARVVTMPVVPHTGGGIGGRTRPLPLRGVPLPPGGGGGGTTTQPGAERCPDGTPLADLITQEDCMERILSCINGGALPNRINDLFDAETRTEVTRGMNLCGAQVDFCLRHAKTSRIVSNRVECDDIFSSRDALWAMFNSQVVQPRYHAFILSRTGLSPNQARRVCLLLDRNINDPSFRPDANIDVWADGFLANSRGEFARWDAVEGRCLIRVAAYDGADRQIYVDLIESEGTISTRPGWPAHSALNIDVARGGSIGQIPAETWVTAGETFTCDEDLFSYQLFHRATGERAAPVDAVEARASRRMNPLLAAGLWAAVGAGGGIVTSRTVAEDRLGGTWGQAAIGAGVAGTIAYFVQANQVRQDERGLENEARRETERLQAEADAEANRLRTQANIDGVTCRVGDRLDQLVLAQQGRVNSLREFYVQWRLEMPDFAQPVGNIIGQNCTDWLNVCSRITGLNTSWREVCSDAAVTYRPIAGNAIRIEGACEVVEIDGAERCRATQLAVIHGACTEAQLPPIDTVPPTVCTPGATENCTIGGAAGTRTCLSTGQWGDCVADDDE